MARHYPSGLGGRAHAPTWVLSQHLITLIWEEKKINQLIHN